MKKLIPLAALLFSTVLFAKNPVADSKIKIHDQDSKGVPTFVTGELGSLGKGASDQAFKAFLKSQKDLLQMAGTEDFDVKSSKKDELGQSHVKFQEKLKGLPVVGAEYIVHADKDGNVFAINGHFVADRDLPRNPSIDSIMAIRTAATQI